MIQLLVTLESEIGELEKNISSSWFGERVRRIYWSFENAGKWAMIGATIGLATSVLGMVAGAIAGALIGGFAGWFGGEMLAKLFDSVISSGNELWNSLNGDFRTIRFISRLGY